MTLSTLVPVPTLVLVPTELEQRGLLELGGLPEALGGLALVGFGPVAAAARTAQLLGARRPARALLLGLAGSFRAHDAPPGSALAFARVGLEGVGVGGGEQARAASQIGFAQWHDERGRVHESLPLWAAQRGELLSVCSASASRDEARARAARHPQALAEDMEGFGVALACHLFGVPLAIVRGISNLVGERERARWDVHGALGAAHALARHTLQRADWERAP